MLFSYNRKNFTIKKDPDRLLLTLYTKLVALELFLKDFYVVQKPSKNINNHDILKYLLIKPIQLPAAQVENLRRRLADLICRNSNGKISHVRPPKYPDIRYIVHESDSPEEPNAVKDTDLENCIKTVDNINSVLKQKGFQ